jgi:hypothetical protein
LSDILSHLLQSQDLEQEINQLGLRNQVNSLRKWQCSRLLFSYDALYQQKKYRAAMDFFTEELYGPNDFTKRDEDIKKVLPLMEKVLSKDTLATFELALKLNTLSYQLDFDLAKKLDGITDISSEQYAEAYRLCNNLGKRQLQLELIEMLANNLAGIAHRTTIMLVLKLSRKPANLAGLGELQAILEKGANAFRKIKKIDGFINPIIQGETVIMQSLFSGDNCLPENLY